MQRVQEETLREYEEEERQRREAEAVVQRAEAEAARAIRAKQEEEYQESLRADQEREAAAKRAAEEVEKAEREERERVEAEEREEERASMSRAALIADCLSKAKGMIRPEPSVDAPGVCDIAMQMPLTGERLRRRFLGSEKVSSVVGVALEWCCGKAAAEGPPQGEGGVDEWAGLLRAGLRVKMAFGGALEAGKTLGESGVGAMERLIVEEDS